MIKREGCCMPKEKEFEKLVNKLYRMKVFDIYLYGYVEGIIRNFRSVQVIQAIKLFLEGHGFEEDDFNFDTAEQTYYKVRDEADILGRLEERKRRKNCKKTRESDGEKRDIKDGVID